MSRQRALVAALALALVGCGQTYDPPSLINKLRVLAIRADPPVMRATAPTTLEPLVVGAPDGAQLCYAWAFCPFAWPKDGNFRCFDPRLQSALGTGSSAVVTPAAVFKALAEAPAVFADLGLEMPDNLPNGSTDEAPAFETYVLFKIATAESEGGSCPSDVDAWLEQPCTDRSACLAGYKRLEFVSKEEDVHQNPSLEGLTIGGVDWPEGVTPTLAWYRGDPDDTFFGLDKGALALEPRWSDASREIIGASIDPSKTEPDRESLLFSWFSTDGDYVKQRTYDEVPENTFLPPCKDDLPLTVWVVVRDGRNGVDWVRREAVVRKDAPTGNPLCAVNASLEGCP